MIDLIPSASFPNAPIGKLGAKPNATPSTKHMVQKMTQQLAQKLRKDGAKVVVLAGAKDIQNASAKAVRKHEINPNAKL